MQHVADGGLPAHLEEQRTRMFVRNDAPAHTSTVEYAGAFASSGLENSFSIERFRKDFRVQVMSLNEEEIVFDLIGIDAALANAFRRILLAEVPTMAIEKVFILNNTSMIQDEVLAQRLGLIPIRADPRKFNARSPDEDADADNVISFRLQVKCSHRRGGAATGAAAGSGTPGGGSSGDGGGRSSDADYVNASVTSADLEWIAQGDQDERFADCPIRPVHDDILIARLRPGQEIELEAWCEKGLGKTHAKWSPVCTASYRLLPEIRVPKRDDDAPELPDRRPKAVFDVDDAPGGANILARPRPCSMKRASARMPGWEERVQMARVKDHFIFTVESTGALPPEMLFQEAVKVLMNKTVNIAQLLNDAVAGQVTGAV